MGVVSAATAPAANPAPAAAATVVAAVVRVACMCVPAVVRVVLIVAPSGCWNIIMLFSLRSRSLHFYLLLLPIFLYLVFGLNHIPNGFLSCRSLSFIIFLQVMSPACVAAQSQQASGRNMSNHATSSLRYATPK